MEVRTGKIHVGDVGTQFIPTFRDTQIDPGTGALIYPILDISTAIELELTFTKPDGVTTIVRDMTTDEVVELFTDGHDGKASFVNKKASVSTPSFPLDVGDAYWQVKGRCKLANDKVFHTDNYQFLVRNKE